MKKTKIIIPAMGMLLLGTAASVTGTVAWFSMNNSVAVTGMNVSTKVGSNILISEDNVESHFKSGLNQVVTGVLEPASSVNGVSFFYHSTTDNVAGDGHILGETFTFSQYDPTTAVGIDAFDANYGLNAGAAGVANCYGYRDYSFYIKVTNGEGAARTLAMDRCNITYKGGLVGDKAWRVALFAVKTDKQNDGTIPAVADATAAQEGNLKTILRLNSAAYFQISDVEKAVASATAFGNLNEKIDDAANIGVLNAADTHFYKIVVRLWLEGNDTTCNNETYAELTGDYQLDLSFKLVNHLAGTPEAGVALISSAANAEATAAGKVGTVTLSGETSGTIANGETAVSFQWYNEGTGAAIDGATSYQYSNTANTAIKAYCMVTTARGNTYRTGTVDLAANS